MSSITISLIKADVGSLCGHHIVHPKQIEVAQESLEKAKVRGAILDYYVFNCGDDLELLMTHEEGENNPRIHPKIRGKHFDSWREIAKKLGYHG